MSDTDDLDLASLIADAEELGIDTKERVVEHLWRIIRRNKEYLQYRSRRGRTGAYNETVARDSVVLGMAIKFIEEK